MVFSRDVKRKRGRKEVIWLVVRWKKDEINEKTEVPAAFL